MRQCSESSLQSQAHLVKSICGQPCIKGPGLAATENHQSICGAGGPHAGFRFEKPSVPPRQEHSFRESIIHRAECAHHGMPLDH